MRRVRRAPVYLATCQYKRNAKSLDKFKQVLTFVLTTKSFLRQPKCLIARPMASSLAPSWYDSAQSKKFMPAS